MATVAQKSKREIIEETRAWYENNPRAVDDEEGCVYFRESDGACCAVGQCLMEPQAFANSYGGVDDVWHNNEQLDADLKPEYRGHSPGFWSDIQSFHDTSEYWSGNKLTDAGEGAYQALLDFWSDR